MTRFQPFSGELPGVGKFYRYASQAVPVVPEKDDWGSLMAVLGGALGGLASRALKGRSGTVVVGRPVQAQAAPLARPGVAPAAAQPALKVGKVGLPAQVKPTPKQRLFEKDVVVVSGGLTRPRPFKAKEEGT